MEKESSRPVIVPEFQRFKIIKGPDRKNPL